MLNKLIAIQSKGNFTDTAFALKLGVTREWWNQVKNGNEHLTSNVKLRAVKEWPELLPELNGPSE